MAQQYNITDVVRDYWEQAKDTSVGLVCNAPLDTLFYYFFLPIIVILLLYVLMRYKEELIKKYYQFFSKRGYVKISYKLKNQRVIEKLVKVDSYNMFKIGKKKYNLDLMYDFIYGYDKYGFPIFLYDENFIMPLKVVRKKIDAQIEKDFNLSEVAEKTKKLEKLSAVIMKIDPTILKTVYDKKLVSDLYAVTTADKDFKKLLFWGVIGVVGFLILYYTGYLEIILSYVGL